LELVSAQCILLVRCSLCFRVIFVRSQGVRIWGVRIRKMSVTEVSIFYILMPAAVHEST
jgi:hypothetical protein